MDPAYLLGTGGAIGAILRHLVSRAVASDRFPVGTLSVNAVGSFSLGCIVFAGATNEVLLFLGVGLCGSFTTFSTFSFETVRLWERGLRRLAVAYALGSLLLSLAAVALAWALVRLLVG